MIDQEWMDVQLAFVTKYPHGALSRTGYLTDYARSPHVTASREMIALHIDYPTAARMKVAGWEPTGLAGEWERRGVRVRVVPGETTFADLNRGCPVADALHAAGWAYETAPKAWGIDTTYGYVRLVRASENVWRLFVRESRIGVLPYYAPVHDMDSAAALKLATAFGAKKCKS